MIHKICLILIGTFLVTELTLAGTVTPKTYSATFATGALKIDGQIDDGAWNAATVAKDFIQLDPTEGAPVSQQTEVRLLYDHDAIYVSAMMFDTHPDSILHELGNRDENDQINSDQFRFGFDPYNKRQDGYVFSVSASGVQTEFLNDDYTFDAVWQSAVAFHPNGWSVEMRIPYSAIRFPAEDEQTWGVQFARMIRRNREYDQWTLTPKDVQNRMNFWGTMTGINHIDPPIRLSLYPYLSVYAEQAPRYVGSEIDGHENSYSYSGGADIKYGIDERFSLDMTLLPDFSQVKSDNKVKNLSAFETIYSENRPFFKEGTSIFSKGNLFYSRRIASTPENYYAVQDQLSAGETLEKNPDKAQLYNATKISGRTDKGLGIGVLNAITGNTYATIKGSDGSQRKVLTAPLTNYNVLVFDQQFKHNCDVYVTNTNVLREGKARDANCTAAAGRFENKNHSYAIGGGGTFTHINQWDGDTKETKDGHLLFGSIDKISGKSWYGISFETANKNFDKNDLGYNFYRDYNSYNIYYTYNIFNPFWKYFKTGSINVYAGRSERASMRDKRISENIGANIFLLFNSNLSFFAETNFYPFTGYDFYEPRFEGRYSEQAPVNYVGISVTTNYNKPLAFDFGYYYFSRPQWDQADNTYNVSPIVRVSDHLNFRWDISYENNFNDRGFADATDESNITFGRRSITTVSNALTARYLFKNDMSLTLGGRHYWSKGLYHSYFFLEQDGSMSPIASVNGNPYDFSANYFTVDLVYNWQFAPGSSFLITYKNQILSDSNNSNVRYFENFKTIFDQPQINSISLKVLYYLDYRSLVRS